MFLLGHRENIPLSVTARVLWSAIVKLLSMRRRNEAFRR